MCYTEEMNIGDKVVSRQTGLPGVGTICGVVAAKLLVLVQGSVPRERWDLLYPDWNNKYICYVEYDEEQYIQSYNEFIMSAPDNMPNDDLRILYKYSPQAHIISYPIDDLELFEHETSSISSD